MSSASTQPLPIVTSIDLLFPLDNGITKLVMRRPKVRDLRAADKIKGGPAEVEVSMFSNLCEVSPDDIDSMDMADYGELQKTYASFLSPRKKTSKSAASS
ncbi:phage tail assembly protein [Methylobacter tundripaludum]|uniref:Tail assembly chaperone E/41/14-like protein n=1 Tax=Methylobacter tundripaludum (strain ATCC BAA-1195 / DSM 17260 / SV96) TaxID=697282 RepID=G3IRG0_METTV|nr:phage tail assembly protein [Methylobacter tundripaludum]EGW22171.1 hypothetical protein Mettu_0972 [Methylobacter tundripaludum SV96]